MNKETYYNIIKTLFCLLFPIIMGSMAFVIGIDGGVSKFIREYQTLISSFVGVIVSIVGVIVIVHQINENSRIEMNIRKRKVNSAVAGITNEISEILKWTNQINNNYKALITANECNDNLVVDRGFHSMDNCQIDTEKFTSMRLIMENTDDNEISARIANLFHNIQINNSRYQSVRNHKKYNVNTNTILSKFYITSNMSLNIRIHAIASDLMSETRFSLGDNDIMKPSEENINNSLNIMGVYEDDFPEIHKQLRKI